MRQHYTATIEITVNTDDRPTLRAYAMSRAISHCGMSETEFVHYENEAYADNAEIEFWLGWAFDAGTPDDGGFQIESSQVEYHHQP